MALVGLSVFATVGIGSYYINRPELEVLYTGLTPTDVSRIGAALREAGISFDVNAEGSKVLVKRGDTAAARMFLAERGLPNSSSAGYELFDKLGSMSLTSFMQNVTRVRALEGEIARTIQAMRSVKAARVHLVLPDGGTLRRSTQPPSASVVLRIESTNFAGTSAIRHLVAAAVPGMTPDQVSVLTTEGTVLAAAGELASAAPVRMLDLEKEVSKSIADNVRRTLVPFLGLDNFDLSVVARLNVDKKQTNETTFDPESKVERSVRTVKETGSSTTSGSKWTVSVEQNVPNEGQGSKPAEQTKKANDRKEELTNFEVSSKTVATASEGYRVEQLSLAVVVNRKRLEEAGQSGANTLDAKVKEVERIVASAAAIDMKRGDKLTVAAVDFVGSATSLEPVPQPGVLDRFWAQSGTLINAAAFLAGTLLVIGLAVRPALRVLAEKRDDAVALAPALPQAVPALDAPGPVAAAVKAVPQPEQAIDDPVAPPRPGAQQKLVKAVEKYEEQAAAVLKDWIRSGA
jgi:flagellar M-ring protein FliF